ncbi:MAG TPA: hypothetical protein VM532_09510 [Burkholderiales bacterium]|nr:hypothetical protein [Burkholderiales bacterium]
MAEPPEAAPAYALLQLIIGCLDEFGEKVKSGLDELDWMGRRELIRTLSFGIGISHTGRN